VNVLVTGGAGYIGSHAVRHLAEEGHSVVVFDSLVIGHAESVPPESLFHGSLEQTARLAAVLKDERVDAVMHFAGRSRVGESVAQPALYYRDNVAGTFSLLEAMRVTGVGKIVFSSTCATYGEPARVPITEDTPQRPVNPYGRSKLIIEQMLEDYAQAYGFSYAALRYFNACGASAAADIGEDHEVETHLIPIALQVALGQREHIDLFGSDYPTPDGTCIRDYIHVDDLAAAHTLALQKLAPGVRLRLNLGTGTGYSVREVIAACRRVTGHPIPERAAPRRGGDPPSLIAEPGLAREVLGWQPRYLQIEEMVESAWAWHSRHPNGFRE
jgi:UDP-glucose 4-epimerase